jgi:hypothetical protein
MAPSSGVPSTVRSEVLPRGGSRWTSLVGADQSQELRLDILLDDGEPEWWRSRTHEQLGYVVRTIQGTLVRQLQDEAAG